MRLEPEAFRFALHTMILELPTGNRKRAKSTDEKVYRAHIGVDFVVVADIWNRIDPVSSINTNATPHHLLWAFMFLKLYHTEQVHAARLKVHPDTWRKWVWAMLDKIEALETSVVRMILAFDCSIALVCSHGPLRLSSITGSN